jgi:hypothetical protein
LQDKVNYLQQKISYPLPAESDKENEELSQLVEELRTQNADLSRQLAQEIKEQYGYEQNRQQLIDTLRAEYEQKLVAAKHQTKRVSGENRQLLRELQLSKGAIGLKDELISKLESVAEEREPAMSQEESSQKDQKLKQLEQLLRAKHIDVEK